jgi:hypothetical protein
MLSLAMTLIPTLGQAFFSLTVIGLSLAQQLPEVDLGYEIHRAVSYNVRVVQLNLKMELNQRSLIMLAEIAIVQFYQHPLRSATSR